MPFSFSTDPRIPPWRRNSAARRGPALFAAVVLLAAVTSYARASPLYSGSLAATWSNPLLTGTDYDGATGAPLSETAVIYGACNLSGCPTLLSGYPGNTVAWGDDPGVLVPPPTSVVTFTGNSFTNVAPGQVIDLGTISYLNGTSAGYNVNDTTTIFGATLTLSATITLGGAVAPLDVAMRVATTYNTGTSAQNADWIGPFGTPVPLSLNAYEGQTVTADLFGEIVGDPMIVLTDLRLDPGQAGNGFIGSGSPVLAPEPATLALFGAGLAALGLARRRAR